MMRAQFKIEISDISKEFIICRRTKEGVYASASYIIENILSKLDEGEYELTIKMKFLGE